MWPCRPFAGFVIRLLIIYGVFCIPWPGVRQGYAALYRGAANGLFGSFGTEGVVAFRPLELKQGRSDSEIQVREPLKTQRKWLTGHTGGADSEIQVRKRGIPYFAKIPFNSILTGYIPMAETIALVLATPIPWRRRWKALLYGVLLVNGFVALRRYIFLLHWFSIEQPWALYKPGPFLSEVLASVSEFIADAPICTFLVPVLIWILVTFRRDDVRRFVASTEEKVVAQHRAWFT